MKIKINSFLLFILCTLTLGLTACTDNKVPMKKDYCQDIDNVQEGNLSKELVPFKDLMENKTGVYVLEDGGSALLSRAWLSDQAEKTIDIQYFIYSLDNIGLIATDYLVRAADRGVKIRILVDDLMVDSSLEDILHLNSHPNISVKIYNPGLNVGKSIFSKLTNVVTDFRSVNQRMHNKTFIVDNKVVITGGRNIADEYFDYDHDYNFRDRDVLLLGNVSGQVTNSFNTFWQDSLSVDVVALASDKELQENSDPNFDALHQYACNPENYWPSVRQRMKELPQIIHHIIESGKLIWLNHVQFVSDDPGKNDGSQGLRGGGLSTDTLAQLIQRAKSSVNIQSPYLVTDDTMRDLFRDAVQRGVRVRVLTNSLASTDNLEAFSGYQSDREKLLNIGIEIYEFKPDAKVRLDVITGELHKSGDKKPVFGHHAKSMVVDDSITVIGTFNLDPRSANLNTECLTILYSKEIASQVMKGIEVEFLPENAWRITNEFNPDSTVSLKKRVKAWTRKVVPKSIL